jgi:hypothetical protein
MTSTSNKEEMSRMTLNQSYLLKHDRNFCFTASGSEPLIIFALPSFLLLFLKNVWFLPTLLYTSTEN